MVSKLLNLLGGGSSTGARRYTFDAAGYLKAIETNDGTEYQLQAQMQYDGLGQRLEMTAYGPEMNITTQYVVDPMLGAQPLTATAEGQVNLYLYGLGPVAEQTDAWAYQLSDGTNTPRQMTDQAGMVTLSGSYTPWGDVLDYTSEGNFTWGYFGGMMDASTGLLYVGNGQYYDPTTGRFLTREAQPGKTNPYVPWGGDTIGVMLAPLALLGMFYSRKRSKGNKIGYLVILLFVTFTVSTTLSACGQLSSLPTSTPSLMPSMPATSTATQTSTPSQTPTATGKTIYLTFDDGADYLYTPQVLFALQAHNAHATFFVTGKDRVENGINRIEATCLQTEYVDPEWQGQNVLKLIKDLGNKIGIHGMYHEDYWDYEGFDVQASITDEVNAINAKLSPYGYAVDPFLRAPGGRFPRQVIPGYEEWYYYGWTISPEVLPETANESIDIINNTKKLLSEQQYPDSPIILLHSINLLTVEAMNGITESGDNLIDSLNHIGYLRFEVLSRPSDHTGFPPENR
jgi:RHS repeat-associated protein